MTPDAIVDILLEMDFSPEEMAEFTKRSMFDMKWTRQAILYGTNPNDPIPGEYKLEFLVLHLGLSGYIHISVMPRGEVSLNVKMMVSAYENDRRRAQTGTRVFTLRRTYFERLREACQKFVREKIPLIVAGERGLSKAALNAQVTAFVTKFLGQVSPRLAKKESTKALLALIDQLKITDDEAERIVKAGTDAGHESAYEEMSQEDFDYWAKVFREWAAKHGIKESDDYAMMRQLTRMVTQEPWIKAQQAWDAEVTAGYGNNPWDAVLGAIGFRPSAARAAKANKLLELMDKVGDWSADTMWLEVEDFVLDGFTAEQSDAIKRLWFRQLGYAQ